MHPLAPTCGNCVLHGEAKLAKEDRGFASMDRGRQREIARKGGRAAHVKGTAHEWSREEARVAGRKGGLASHRRKPEGDAPIEQIAPAKPAPAEGLSNQQP